MPKLSVISGLLCLLILSACMSAQYLGSEIQEERSMSLDYNASKTITLKKEMIFLNSRIEATEGVYLPPATYTCIGQDEDYIYFECPFMLERRRFHNAELKDQWMFKGGIALAKDPDHPVQAAVFVNGYTSEQKGLTWILGDIFLRKKGKLWTKNY